MFPPHPQLSLPTPKYFSFHGLSRPFARRSFASVESPSAVMYSTHSIISCTVPLPTLPQMYGSAPDRLTQIHELVRPKLIRLDHARPSAC